MTDDGREAPTRRAVLGASVGCLSAGMAGCSRYRRGSDVGTPGDQEVRIDVTVRGPEGEGLADEPVVLVDTGGTTDTQTGHPVDAYLCHNSRRCHRTGVKRVGSLLCRAT